MARILVVDDERDVVTLIKFLLEKDGHAITEAFHGAEALAAVGVEPSKPDLPLPDLVIMDVMMPVMDGYTAAMRLRENPATRPIPLIVLTAKGQMRDLFEMAPNVAGYIEKPFDPKRLRELVAGALSGKGGTP